MQMVQDAIRTLLTELIDGPAGFGCWVINRDEPGMLGLLATLSAEEAKQSTSPGRTTLAAHVRHMSYALSLLNRWAGGEENPFATADWEGSWQLDAIDDDAWQALIAQLETEAHAWRDAVQQPREWDELSLTGAIASCAHIAYHFGAMKQIVLSVGH